MPEIPLADPAGAAGVLLAVYLEWVVRGLKAAPREHDPQGGRAVGCLTIVALGLFGPGAVPAAGAYWDVPWLVRAVFGVVSCPLIGLARGAVSRHVRTRRR